MTEKQYRDKKRQERDPTYDPKNPQQQNKDPVFFSDVKFFDYTYSGRNLKEIVQEQKELRQVSVFRRFVEPGRLVVFNLGPFFEGVGIIVDIIDKKRILVSGPRVLTGVPRHVTTTSRVRLTDICVKDCKRGIDETKLFDLVKEQKILERWSQTLWAQKIRSRANKRNFTDFERFKVQQARDKRSRMIRKFMKNESKKASIQRGLHFKRTIREMQKNIDKGDLTHIEATQGPTIHDAVDHQAYRRESKQWESGQAKREAARVAKREKRAKKDEAVVKKLAGK